MDRKEAINAMVGSVFKDTDKKCLKCMKDTRKCLEIIEENAREEAVRKFAEKIKSHMMMYCRGRLEQQYCAMEVIDYIAKLMGEKDFSIDVEKEMAEHDKSIQEEAVRKFAEWVEQHFDDESCLYADCEGRDLFDAEKALVTYEKERKNDNA